MFSKQLLKLYWVDAGDGNGGNLRLKLGGPSAYISRGRAATENAKSRKSNRGWSFCHNLSRTGTGLHVFAARAPGDLIGSSVVAFRSYFEAIKGKLSQNLREEHWGHMKTLRKIELESFTEMPSLGASK